MADADGLRPVRRVQPGRRRGDRAGPVPRLRRRYGSRGRSCRPTSASSWGSGPTRSFPTWATCPPLFTVGSYDAVHEVLKDGQRFSSSGYAEVMGAVMGHTILEMDEPEHHEYRALIQQAFTRKEMEAWEADLVGPIVDELIDSFVDDGRADLVTQLTFPFPVNVIAGLLGLAAGRPAAVPPLDGRAHQRGHRHGTGDRRVEEPVRLPHRVHRGPAGHARAGHDQRPRPGRARRHPPHQRRDLRVPAASCCPPAPRRRTGRRRTCCSGC